MLVKVWVWCGLYPLVQRFCRENDVAFNRLVNLALQSFLGGCDVEVLRLLAEKDILKREERELKDDWRVIARSGSFLPGYVDRVVKPQDSPVRLGSVPLGALSRDEEDVFLRIAYRREAIARRLVEIEQVLLPKERFRVDGHARDRFKREGGEVGDAR